MLKSSQCAEGPSFVAGFLFFLAPVLFITHIFAIDIYIKLIWSSAERFLYSTHTYKCKTDKSMLLALFWQMVTKCCSEIIFHTSRLKREYTVATSFQIYFDETETERFLSALCALKAKGVLFTEERMKDNFNTLKEPHLHSLQFAYIISH